MTVRPTGMRIAMLGCRGVPATHGGVERHVEEIGARLVERGHRVTVYCRSGYTGTSERAAYRGMRVVTLPAVPTKHLEALSHMALAAPHALAGRHDLYHFHAIGPGLFAPLTRAVGAGSTVLTVHGVDHHRAKWGPTAARLLRHAERAAVAAADEVVVVASDLVERYALRFGIDATHIPNGVERPTPADPPDRANEPYLLFVGRLTPEKQPDLLLRAFRRLPDPRLRLFLAGGTSHTDRFVDRLFAHAREDPRVRLLGYRYGPELAGLYAGARLFVQPSALEGMPLTLLEAAAHGIPLVTSDIAVHRAVLGEAGPGRRLFRSTSEDDLVRALSEALAADPPGESAAARRFGDRIVRDYTWDGAVDRLERVYLEARRGPRSVRVGSTG